ncbi:MAG: TIGR00730 family Rossman fold protein [Rhizomicrobium sp.]
MSSIPITPPKKTACVFCGSSVGRNPSHLETARRSGELIGRKGCRMVYGGGASGMMGEVARAALTAGAEVIGVRPSPLDHLERPQGGIEMIHTPDLFERKQRMIGMSDVFLVLPGGLGTLDEFFEVITTAQLGMHEKPVILVNTDAYFDPLLALLRWCDAEGFIYGKVHRLFQVAPTADAAFDLF